MQESQCTRLLICAHEALCAPVSMPAVQAARTPEEWDTSRRPRKASDARMSSTLRIESHAIHESAVAMSQPAKVQMARPMRTTVGGWGGGVDALAPLAGAHRWHGVDKGASASAPFFPPPSYASRASAPARKAT